MSPKRDPQRHRVYSMESDLFVGFARIKFSRKTIRSLAKLLCEWFNVPQVRIHYGKIGGGFSGEFVAPLTITLDESQATPMLTVFTHEMAHFVLYHLVEKHNPGVVLEDHGPNFVGVHGMVLHWLQLLPLPLFEQACRAYGVWYVHPLHGRLRRPRRVKLASVRLAYPYLDRALLKDGRSNRLPSSVRRKRARARAS